MKFFWFFMLYFFASPPKLSGQAKKNNKKRAPKTITPRFREGALIKLLHYCSFISYSLI